MHGYAAAESFRVTFPGCSQGALALLDDGMGPAVVDGLGCEHGGVPCCTKGRTTGSDRSRRPGRGSGLGSRGGT